MKGKVLGYSSNDNEGVIVVDEKRYKFEKEDWKESQVPQKGMEVDFINEAENAKEIYLLVSQDKDTTLLGIISLAITFFLGFIGTLISRMVISKHSFSQALMPTLGHLAITLLALIPVLGWIFYVVGTIYFMVKNYQLVLNPQGINKYE